MTDWLFFDTNLLVYLLDPEVPDKRSRASQLVRAGVDRSACVVSPQILNECYRVLTIKRNLVPVSTARAFVTEFIPFCRAPLDEATTQLAFAVQDTLRASWWDCVMVASAFQAGCRLVLTEDMQTGRNFQGMELVDPFQTSIDVFAT